VGEAQEWQGKPLYQVVLEQTRQCDIRTAIVIRGIEGFGPERHLSTERLLDISDNLPLIVEIVDTDERIEAVLPVLDRLIQRGMITMIPVQILSGREAPGR
jgi:PII-like signaling protein